MMTNLVAAIAVFIYTNIDVSYPYTQLWQPATCPDARMGYLTVHSEPGVKVYDYNTRTTTWSVIKEDRISFNINGKVINVTNFTTVTNWDKTEYAVITSKTNWVEKPKTNKAPVN